MGWWCSTCAHSVDGTRQGAQCNFYTTAYNAHLIDVLRQVHMRLQHDNPWMPSHTMLHWWPYNGAAEARPLSCKRSNRRGWSMFILCQYVCHLPSQLPQANNFWLIDLQTGTFFVISHGSALATRYSILHQRALVRMMDPARSEMGNRNPTMSLGVTALALAGVARTSQLKQETIVLHQQTNPPLDSTGQHWPVIPEPQLSQQGT